jgi:chemotaxis regulatin CheY-phosphate phosphatase CheZ
MDKEQTTDNINPNHYKQGNIEVIDFIIDQDFNYLEGNVIKYVSRYKFKNGVEDLKKAQWYLKELIDVNT